MNKNFYILFILYINYLIYSFCYLILPFKRNLSLSFCNYNNIMEKLYINDIFTYISLGTPNKKYSFQIKLNQIPFSILGEEAKKINLKKFSQNSSCSSKFYDDETYFYEKEEFFSGILLTENIVFPTDKKTYNLKNFSIYYITDINKNGIFNETGIIGLNIENNEYKLGYAYNTNLITQLNNYNLIKEKTFNFKYNEEDKGILIIGEYPNNYDKNYKNYVFTQIESLEKWSINFNVYYDNEILFNSQNCLFEIEKGFLIAPDYFLIEIENLFFKEQIKKKLCEKKNFFFNSKNITYFVCDKNVNFKYMKNLYIKNVNGLNYYFIFTYKDLIYKYKNKIYYLIVFSDEKNWILGKPFFKKYQLIFDSKKKTIGYCKYYSKNNKMLSKVCFMIIILLIIIVLYLLYIIIFVKKKFSRKIKLNELAENYEYF